MAEWRTFINKTGTSNKYWRFRQEGCSIIKEWGRIGGPPSAQTKEFPTPHAAVDYAMREVDKKLRKGYVESSGEDLQEESDIARTLGTQWKINRVEFLGSPPELHSQPTLELGERYQPDCGVYVELLQCWTKESAHLVLTKRDAAQYGAGQSVPGGVMLAQSRPPNPSFVEGVRKAIRELAQMVAEATVRFAAVGVRVIDGADAPQALVEQVAAKSGASTQAVSKFAALGRVLEI